MKIPYSVNCNGRLLSFSKPIVMGILNVTPDSFFDGKKNKTVDEILSQTEKMIQEGATIIDIGGMSSKPGAQEISVQEEMDRVLPVLQILKKNFSEIFISIDTTKSEIALESIKNGADIINDISAGLWDNNMLNIIAENNIPYIAMHIQGKPENMQDKPMYHNVCLEIYDFFIEKIEECKQKNIHDFILDVGFGFGKSVIHNFELLKNLSLFKNLQKPILVGISRKSMICKPLKVNPANALNGTTALHMLALQNGANILRVHDVKEAIECIKLYEIYNDISNSMDESL